MGDKDRVTAPNQLDDSLYLGRLNERPVRTDKPWGHEILWAHTDRYVGKVLHINDGESLSLQYHEEKDETIYVMEGTLVFTFRVSPRPDGIFEQRTTLKAGEKMSIPPRVIHRMEAFDGPVTLMEVSSPEIHDIVRLEDWYGRASTTGGRLMKVARGEEDEQAEFEEMTERREAFVEVKRDLEAIKADLSVLSGLVGKVQVEEAHDVVLECSRCHMPISIDGLVVDGGPFRVKGAHA